MHLAILPSNDIWNISRLCEELNFTSITFGQPLKHFHLDIESGSVEINENSIEIDKIEGALYLPLNYENGYCEPFFEDSSDPFRALQIQKLNQFLINLLEKCPRTINPPHQSSVLANKAVFSILFQQARVKSPRTIISNAPTAVSARFPNRSAVVKVISSHNHLKENVALPASLFSPEELECHSESIRDTPLLYQEYIRSDIEYRTFFICRDVITIEIIRSPDIEILDFRFREDDGASYSICTDPKLREIIENSCSRLFEAVHIPYFCVDWLYLDNDACFIDFNPHGSWYWLPDSIRHRIDDFFFAAVNRYFRRTLSQ